MKCTTSPPPTLSLSLVLSLCLWMVPLFVASETALWRVTPRGTGELRVSVGLLGDSEEIIVFVGVNPLEELSALLLPSGGSWKRPSRLLLGLR